MLDSCLFDSDSAFHFQRALYAGLGLFSGLTSLAFINGRVIPQIHGALALLPSLRELGITACEVVAFPHHAYTQLTNIKFLALSDVSFVGPDGTRFGKPLEDELQRDQLALFPEHLLTGLEELQYGVLQYYWDLSDVLLVLLGWTCSLQTLTINHHQSLSSHIQGQACTTYSSPPDVNPCTALGNRGGHWRLTATRGDCDG